MFFTFWVHPVLPVPAMLSFSELDKTSISQLKNKKIKKKTPSIVMWLIYGSFGHEEIDGYYHLSVGKKMMLGSSKWLELRMIWGRGELEEEAVKKWC